MSESSQARSVVVLDPSQVPAARELAAAHHVEVVQVPLQGIEPVATVTLVLIGAASAVRAIEHLLDQRKGGQVIDLRPGAPKAFYRTPDLAHGMVIIVTAEGKVTVEVKEPAAMFGKVIGTLPGLISGGARSAEELAQTVRKTYGPDVEVELAEIPDRDGGS